MQQPKIQKSVNSSQSDKYLLRGAKDMGNNYNDAVRYTYIGAVIRDNITELIITMGRDIQQGKPSTVLLEHFMNHNG